MDTLRTWNSLLGVWLLVLTGEVVSDSTSAAIFSFLCTRFGGVYMYQSRLVYS